MGAAAGALPAAQGSFGVSNGGTPAGAMPKSGSDFACDATTAAMQMQSNDFVTILGANPAANNIIDALFAPGEGGNDVLCGRYFATGAAAAADATVCSRVTPFRLGVHFDGYEAVAAAGAFVMEHLDEASGKAMANDATLGVFGFSLGFRQMACA